MSCTLGHPRPRRFARPTMSEIPFRSLATAPTSLRLSENFDFRYIDRCWAAAMWSALHRHDHYFPRVGISKNLAPAAFMARAHSGHRLLSSAHPSPAKS